jgi:hypothetical protein
MYLISLPGISHFITFLDSVQIVVQHLPGFYHKSGAHHSLLCTRSLHSPLFSGRTPVGLRRTRLIQNANFLALEWLELSGDFPVTFRCMLVGLSPNQQSNSTRNDQTAAESPTEVRRTPTDTKQTAFLISIINKN